MASRMHWIVFFGALILCWALLFLIAVPRELRAPGSGLDGALTGRTGGGSLGASGVGPAFAMWTLMSAAMMAPTAIPAFRTYADIVTVAATGFGRRIQGPVVQVFS